jgi:hypothetical protein
MSTCCRDKGKFGSYCAGIITPEVHPSSNTETTFCIASDLSPCTLTACSPGCNALPDPSGRPSQINVPTFVVSRVPTSSRYFL